MSLDSLDIGRLLTRFDPVRGTIQGARHTERRLSDLRGVFQDQAAWQAACAAGNPIVYAVDAAEPGHGEGDLHFGIGIIQPGKIANEYFITKGHLHEWREAAELYIGLSGQGMMLLEDEATGESRMLPLGPGQAVYVPGHTGHRTANVGMAPLTYIGVYPALAGHDYGHYAAQNFRCVIIEENGAPKMVRRDSFP